MREVFKHPIMLKITRLIHTTHSQLNRVNISQVQYKIRTHTQHKKSYTVNGSYRTTQLFAPTNRNSWRQRCYIYVNCVVCEPTEDDSQLRKALQITIQQKLRNLLNAATI